MTFFSIFSKNKPQKVNVIIVDNREKNSLVCSELVKLGFQIKFEQLAVADYLAKETAIERKTIQDLKASIINKRIFAQLKDIKQYEKKFLIIEGINQDIYEGIIHENAFRGFMVSLGQDYNMPVIYTLNEKDTAKYISLIYSKKQNSQISLRASKVALTKEERLQNILEGFPGIGPATARKLLEHFKSLKNIINSSSEELQKIIGKKSEELTKIVNETYNQSKTSIE